MAPSGEKTVDYAWFFVNFHVFCKNGVFFNGIFEIWRTKTRLCCSSNATRFRPKERSRRKCEPLKVESIFSPFCPPFWSEATDRFALEISNQGLLPTKNSNLYLVWFKYNSSLKKFGYFWSFFVKMGQKALKRVKICFSCMKIDSSWLADYDFFIK